MCPDFPKTGATTSEIWSYSTREISRLTGSARTDVVGQDNTLEASTGTRVAKIDNVDTTISTRLASSAFDTRLSDTRAGKIDNVDTTVSSRAAPLDILADSTKITGSNINAAISTRAAPLDILADATKITGSRISRLDSIPAFLAPTESSIAMTGSEQTLIEITDIKSSEVEAWIDLTPIAVGDTIAIKYYRKLKSGGSYVMYANETYSNVQSIPALCIMSKKVYRDVKVTAQQTTTGSSYKTLDVQAIRAKEA